MWWSLIILVLGLNEYNAKIVCDSGVCIQKCCPLGQHVLDRKRCISYEKNLDLTQLPVYNETLEEVGRAADYFSVKYGALLDEEFKKAALKVTNATIFLLKNGTARIKGRISVLRRFDQYCVDYNLLNISGNLVHRDNVFAWVTFNNTQDDADDIPLFFKCGALISSFFLFLVIVVYAMLPELRNLGGLVLMAYVASLMFAFLFLFTIQVGAVHFEVPTCLAITYLTYYFLISSFSWMTVMSYDIWWTFRGYAKARPIHRRGEHFKFAMYCLCAWGLPLALTVFLALINDSSTSPPTSKFIRPQIPGGGCFIEGDAKLAYLYGPMSIMIALNWVFYILTAFNIWRLSRGTHMLNSADSSATGSAAAHHTNKQRLIVYLKLSVLMGLSWILEVVSSFHKDYKKAWYISDAYNILIGVVIFITFVCKKKIYMKLKKRYKDKQSTTSFQSRSRSTMDTNQLQIPLKSKFPSVSS